MRYEGKLYGNVGGRSYFDTGKTTEDWDKLEQSLAAAKKQLEVMRGRVQTLKKVERILEKTFEEFLQKKGK